MNTSEGRWFYFYQRHPSSNRIIDRWNKDHFFLTGVDDYPMAAMHAAGDLSVEEIGVQAEEIHKQLRKAKFSSGEQLQLVSHLLVFSADGPREAVHRFQARSAGFDSWVIFWPEKNSPSTATGSSAVCSAQSQLGALS